MSTDTTQTTTQGYTWKCRECKANGWAAMGQASGGYEHTAETGHTTETATESSEQEAGIKATELRQKAAESDRKAAESFERCDTDGFVSQWAHGISASKDRLQALIEEQGGTHEFRGLFNSDGERIKAKRVQGTDYFGKPETKWIVLDDNDRVMHWVNIPKNPDNPSGRSKMGKLGLHEAWEENIPAVAILAGGGMGLAGAANVRAKASRTDAGFPEGSIVMVEVAS